MQKTKKMSKIAKKYKPQGKSFVDRHAKRIAREGCATWIHEGMTDDLHIVVAKDGVPIMHGVAATMKSIAFQTHLDEWRIQRAGRLTDELLDKGRNPRTSKCRFEDRVISNALPTAQANHRDRPHLYDNDTCMICGLEPEDTGHWLLRCEGDEEVKKIRDNMRQMCCEIIGEGLKETTINTVSGWYKRPHGSGMLGKSSEEWKKYRGRIEHSFIARWIRTSGNRVYVRPGDGTGAKSEHSTTIAILWRLIALWEGEVTTEGGRAFAEEATKLLKSLEDGALRGGRSARKKEMCWATPRDLLWIFVEELGIEGELACDLKNMFEGFSKWWTWEENTYFRGGGRIRQNGMRKTAFEEARYGYANPEYNGEDADRGNEKEDSVKKTIRLASACVKEGEHKGSARRYVLVVPLFKRGSDMYRKMILNTGGRIIYECPPGTMGFIPDRHWKGDMRGKVGSIKHAIGIVLFENNIARKEKPYDEGILHGRLKSWHIHHQELQKKHGDTRAEPPGQQTTMQMPIPSPLCVWQEKRALWGERARGQGMSEGSKSTPWFTLLTWNPVLGALGYLPPEMKPALKELGSSGEMVDDKCTRLSRTLRAGTKELWSARNVAQLRIESEYGITMADKRDKSKARTIRQESKGLSAKQKASSRQAESIGKIFKPPLVDAVGRVITRYCVEADCQRETAVKGRFCPTCDARLPSRARMPWRPMTKVEEDPWENESDYWKARAIEIIRPT